MKLKLVSAKISVLCLVLLLVFAAAENAAAQIDEAVVIKQKEKALIRPRSKPAPKKVDVTKKVAITRVEKKSRSNYVKPAAKSKTAPKPAIKQVQVPLLAVQLKLLLVNNDGSEAEVNPLASFTPNDRLRLSITPNQRGYLYIVRQSSPEADGEIIFPTTLVNGGSNLVSANYEYVIPNNCPKELVPNPHDCALKLLPYAESPQEYFTLIFTRDQLVDLPNDAKNTRVGLGDLLSAGKLEAKILVALIEDSGQDLFSQQGDTPYAVRIVNVNPKDNEEIIETFVLNKLRQ